MKKNKMHFFLLVVTFAVLFDSAYAEQCSIIGETQVRYVANGCDYLTLKRECCSTTNSWSEWGEDCPICPENTCWNGKSCEYKDQITKVCSVQIAYAVSGTLTRTASCNEGKGWTYGPWQGSCVCRAGYGWNVSKCIGPLYWRKKSVGTVQTCAAVNNCASSIEGVSCSSPYMSKTICVPSSGKQCVITNFSCEK